MRDMCDDWDKRAETLVRCRPELDYLQAISIHSLAHRAIRSARGILTLVDAGADVEIMPLVRLTFEAAVTAAWLLLTPNSGLAIMKEDTRKRKALLEDMASTDSAGYRQSTETFEQLKKMEMPGSASVEQRCLALEDGRHLYGLYRAASAYCHAGLGLLEHHAVEDSNSDIGMAFVTNPSFTTQENWIGITCCMLLLALNADEQARLKPTRTSQLRQFARRIGVTGIIRRADGSTLPPRGNGGR